MKQEIKNRRERFQTEIIDGDVSNSTSKLRICPYTGQQFKPTSQRQIFIDEDARIKFNNEKRSKTEKKKNAILNKINKNEQILKEGYNSISNLGIKSISKEAFQFSGYDFNACTSVTTNQVTGMQIYWAINYGIEESKTEKGAYVIIKK